MTLMNVIVTKLKYAGESFERGAKLAKKLKAVKMAAAKQILVYSEYLDAQNPRLILR